MQTHQPPPLETWRSEPLYPPFDLRLLVHALRERGVPARDTLRDTGIEAEPACIGNVSIAQMRQAWRNARRLVPDPALALWIGARSSLRERGVAGLMLGACASVAEYVELAGLCEGLAMLPVPAGHYVVSRHDVRWVAITTANAAAPDELSGFLMELRVAQHVRHLEDALGRACPPTVVRFAHTPATPLQDCALQLGGPCEVDAGRCEIVWPREVLAWRPRAADPVAFALLRAGCDALLAELDASPRYAARVARALHHATAPNPGMPAVAAALHVTERTLRRRLLEEGTSFSAIAMQLQCDRAKRQLGAAGACIDDIAASTGYADPANFRRAFIRWTSMSPAQFRRLQRR